MIKVFDDKTQRIIKFSYKNEESDKYELDYQSYWQLSGTENHWNGKNHMFLERNSFAKE